MEIVGYHHYERNSRMRFPWYTMNSVCAVWLKDQETKKIMNLLFVSSRKKDKRFSNLKYGQHLLVFLFLLILSLLYLFNIYFFLWNLKILTVWVKFTRNYILSLIICNYAYPRNAKSFSHYSPLSIGLRFSHSFDKGFAPPYYFN